MFINKLDRDLLLKLVQKVIGIIEKKHNLPILSNLLIEASSQNIRLIASDLESQIIANHVLETNESEFSVTVSAKKIQEILRVLPEKSDISLEYQSNRLSLKCNKSKFSIQTLPASDYPTVIENIEINNSFSISHLELKKLISSVIYSMAQQDIRYYLNGVLFVIENNKLCLVATDGHRLAYAESFIESVNTKFEFILPRKAVAELSKNLIEADEKIIFEVGEKQVKTSLNDITLVSKLIDGKFPDFQRVIPIYSNHIIIDRLSLLQALQRSAILSNERFKGVRIVLTENNLRIISTNGEQEEAQEDIENEYHGPAIDIGFNVNYLIDGLNGIGDEKIMLSFGDSNSSILLSVEDKSNFKYVVMPMRI
jgi:DNA polymerase-3 subunit beta